MGVEVKDADAALAVELGDRRRRWKGYRMVAAKDNRYRARPKRLTHFDSHRLVSQIQRTGRAIGVSKIDHIQVIKRIYAQPQVMQRSSR